MYAGDDEEFIDKDNLKQATRYYYLVAAVDNDLNFAGGIQRSAFNFSYDGFGNISLNDTRLWVLGDHIFMAARDALNDIWRLEKRNTLTWETNSDFGDKGVVTHGTAVASLSSFQAMSSDGSNIFLAGLDNVPGNIQWRVISYNNNGALNAIFGSAGVLTQNPTAGSNDRINAMAVDTNYLYIAGQEGHTGDGDFGDWHFEKRNKVTGALCDSLANCSAGPFDTDGVIHFDPGDTEACTALAIDTNHIYLAGFVGNGGDNDWRIEKRRIDTGALCTGGTCGTNFDGDGAIDHDFTGGDDVINSMIVDSNYVYAAGAINNSSEWMLVKHNISTGAICNSVVNCAAGAFDGDGQLQVNPSAGNDALQLILQDETYLYLIGYSLTTFAKDLRIEKRKKGDGSLEANFGTNGVVTRETFEPVSAYLADGYIYITEEGAFRVQKYNATTGAIATGPLD